MMYKRFVVGVTRNIDYIVMENTAEMFEYSKTNTGIYRIDAKNKKVLWFKDTHEAQMYTERVEKISLNSNKLHEASNHGDEAKNKRYYQGFLWVYAYRFDEDELKNAVKQAPKRFKNSKNIEFDDLDEAVKWIKEQKISAAADKIIKNSIKKNLDGLSQKSYYMTWNYVGKV